MFQNIQDLYEEIDNKQDTLKLLKIIKKTMLGIDKRTASRNERSNENAKKAPEEENRTRNLDTGMKEK